MRWLRHKLLGTEFIVVSNCFTTDPVTIVPIYISQGIKYVVVRQEVIRVSDLNKEAYFWLYKNKEKSDE